MKRILLFLALAWCSSFSASADLVHRYSFNDPVGSLSATDSVGGLAWSATLNGTAALDGSQLVLDGTFGTFAQLPGGAITNATAVTVETWVTFGTQIGDWTRLFSFGNMDSGGAVLSEFRLTPRAAGNYVDVFFGTPAGNAYANHPQGLDNQTNVHVVVVLDPATGFLGVYTNGVRITGAPSATLPSLSTFTNELSYLGKSFFAADPYLTGSIDEFRIWNQALSRAAIEASFEGGPNNVNTNPGALQSIQLSLAQTNLSVGLDQTATLQGSYANLTNAIDLTGSPGISYVSADTNVVTVSSNGLIKAIGSGTTTLTAGYQGLFATQSVNVAQNFLAPAHRYSFNDAPGSTTVVDSVGGPAWNGTLFGNASLNGSQLVLDGSNGSYLGLPAGVIGNGKAVTVEAWASFGTQSGDWSRFLSFGSVDAQNNISEQLHLTPRAPGNYVDLNYLGVYANHPQGWDNQTNLHIVAVVNPPSGFLGIYANGVLIGKNSTATTPLSPAPDQLSYVGKSIYPPDPYLIGSIDELRIYEGALSPDRIAIDMAAGPNNIVTNAGSLQSATLLLTNVIHLGESLQAVFSGNFANVSNVDLFQYGTPAVNAGDTNVVSVSSSGLVTGLQLGQTTVNASFSGFQSAVAVQVVPATLTHRFSFNDAPSSTNVSDSVGGTNWNGTLNGSATLNGTNLVLDGNNGYVQLPSGIIGGYSAVSIETWASFGGNGKWARLWDFGDQNAGGNGNSSLYFTPHNGGDGSQITMFKPGAGTDVALTTNLDNLPEMQIVGVYTGSYMELYFNGALVGRKSPVSLKVTDVLDVNSFIGKSMFNADPYFTGSVDEFRIYQGALTASAVASNFAAGPSVVPTPAPSLSIKLGQGAVTITWPAGGRYILGTTTNLATGWSFSDLPVTNENGQMSVTDLVTNQARFYRLQLGP